MKVLSLVSRNLKQKTKMHLGGQSTFFFLRFWVWAGFLIPGKHYCFNQLLQQFRLSWVVGEGCRVEASCIMHYVGELGKYVMELIYRAHRFF